MRPFLPDTEDSSAVCAKEEALSYSNVTQNVVDDAVQVETLIGTEIPALAWPFLIIALVHLLTAVGYCSLSIIIFNSNSFRNMCAIYFMHFLSKDSNNNAFVHS